MEDPMEEEPTFSFETSQHEIFERAKWTPTRLTDAERGLLQILEGALEISEYTDNVDVSSSMYRYRWQSDQHHKKHHIIKRELKKMLAFLLGLYVSSDYRIGEKLINENELSQNEQFFTNVMEIGRRYKILCPDKMRTNYGKLMHMMQDAVIPGMIELSISSDIKCVYHFLREKKCLELLNDVDIVAATECIISGTREELESLSSLKKAARNRLKSKFVNENFKDEDLFLVLESLTDSNAYLVSNRLPVDKMIQYLKKYFDPDRIESGFSLEIRNGKEGSCLSHNHSTQFTYVYQSLQLWREIQDQMYMLWIKADADLLEENGYSLTDTGQGLNRVQSAPRVGRAMSNILSKVRSKVGGWVGLSVVHLGDRDVPNALVFIDKYTQVPRILAPIAQTIDRLGELVENPKIKPFIDEFGDVETVRKEILCDFFKHGFDGSGDDGGSCVDGRLTSAWNWCSKIEKKPYYPVFLMTGFYGFDGSFKK